MEVESVMYRHMRSRASVGMAGPVGMSILVCLLIAAAGGCTARDQSHRTGGAWAHSRADAQFDTGADKPPSPDTMYGLARILMSQGRPVESITLLRNTIGQYPKYLPAYNALAEAHLWLGQTDEAIAALTEGLRRGPNDPVLLNNLGMTLFLDQRYEEALPYFERAAALRPEDATYRANQAAALGMLGRLTEARVLYRQIVSPGDVGANIRILDQARRGGAAHPEPEEVLPRQATVGTSHHPDRPSESP
jgi:Flp pilus assembly protein TadD